MSDWPPATLGEIADLGFGATPSRSVPAFWDERPHGHAWATIADLRSDPVEDTAERISDLAVRLGRGRRVAEGTPMMSFKLTIGRVARAGRPLYTNEAIVSVEGRAGLADSSWLYHVLPRIARAAVSDTAVKGATLNKAKLERLTLALPPLEEQRRIALTLDTVDKEIRLAEREQAKRRRIHSALRESLMAGAPSGPFTRIPLSELVDERRPITYGIVQPGPRQSEGRGVPVVRGQDYDNSMVRTESLYWVLPAIAAAYRRASLEPNDLLLSIVGVYVGTVGQVPQGLRGANITQTTARVAIRAPHNPRYFFHQMIGQRFQNEVRRFTKGSAQPGLNLSDVERMTVLVPSPEEQAKIATALDESLATLNAQDRSLAKLRALRAGLADDLLTGRVRTVPV